MSRQDTCRILGSGAPFHRTLGQIAAHTDDRHHNSQRDRDLKRQFGKKRQTGERGKSSREQNSTDKTFSGLVWRHLRNQFALSELFADKISSDIGTHDHQNKESE